MNKQYIRLGSFVLLLIVCVCAYFMITNYYDNKEQEEEKANSFTAFSLDEYKDTKKISYQSDSGTITLERKDKQWKIKGQSKINVDESVVETDMLALLVEVVSDEKMEDVTDLKDYGFTKTDKKITASTNEITIVDSKDKEHTIYLGNANPYDTSKYYMMVKGDDSVYVVDSSVVDGFSKTVDDLEKEEETTTESSSQEG